MLVNMNFKDPLWAAEAVTRLREIAREHKGEIAECIKNGQPALGAIRAMGQAGLIGVMTPAQFGGSGGSAPEYCLVAETAARYGLPSIQAQIQGQGMLLECGTAEQKARYLPGLCDGSLILAEAISEPGAGSSLKNLKTRAVRKGGDWVLNGMKTHISAATFSNVTAVFAQTDEGLTAFLVDTSLKGYSAKATDPLGGRLALTSDVVLDNVIVPSSAVLGAPGSAMAPLLATFNLSRLGNASDLIGRSRQALSAAIEYAKGRAVGQSVVTEFQGIQWTVADCYAALYGASAVRDHGANLVAQGKRHEMESSLAKKLAVDAAEKTANEVFALVGAHGLYWDEPFGQILLDIKTMRVAGGSVEVLRNFIARQVLKDPAMAGLS